MDKIDLAKSYGVITCNAEPTEINEGAFEGRKNLESIVIPDMVTVIKTRAFSNCINLKDIKLSENIENIGSYAFNNCSSLSSFTISSGITELDDFVLANCESIENISIPDNIIEIGDGSFSGCHGLTRITIGSGTSVIPQNAFNECKSISSIVISNNNETYDSRDNSNAIINTDSNTIIRGSNGTTEFPKSVSAISDYGMADNIGIERLVIENNIKYLGHKVFSGCENLHEIIMLNSESPTFCSDTFEGLPEDGGVVYCFENVVDFSSNGLPESWDVLYLNTIEYKTTDNKIISNKESLLNSNFGDDSNVIKPLTITEPLPTGNNQMHAGEIIGRIVFTGTPTIIPYNCFRHTNLSEINLPNSISGIKSYAFAFTNLTELTIPDNVVYFNEGIIDRCEQLERLEIGSGCTNSFANLTAHTYGLCSLNTIVVSPNNPSYDSRNNCNAAINTSTNELILGSNTTIIPNSVTSIGEYAFYERSGLTSISIPNSVTAIHTHAFAQNINLSSITIPDSVTDLSEYAIFESCSGLISATIGNGASVLGNCTFRNCVNLKYVTLGNGLTAINEQCFSYCNNIESLVIPNSVRYMSIIFSNSLGPKEITFGSGITTGSLRSTIWSACTNISSMTFTEGITQIPSGCFMGCANLKTLTLPNTLTSIGKNGFSDCSGVTDLTIGSGLSSFSGLAIQSGMKYSLERVTLLNGRTDIPSSAFMRCTRLSSITVPNSVTAIQQYCFQEVDQITNIDFLPENLQIIGDYAFYACEQLSAINIPNNVVNIGTGVFYWCSSASSLSLPSSLVTLGDAAFTQIRNLQDMVVGGGINPLILDKLFTKFNLNSLTSCTFSGESTITYLPSSFLRQTGVSSITIPSSVTMISGNNFLYMTQHIREIISLNPIAPSLGDTNTFNYVIPYMATNTQCTLYYPQGSDYSTWLTRLNNEQNAAYNIQWTGQEIQT